MRLTASAFQAGAAVPARFTCDGADVSPALRWDDPPPGTQSLALVVDDPDAPARTWVHWIVYDIPSTERGLPEGINEGATLVCGARQGRNDFGRSGYGGPCPPPGPPHRYRFTLFALDAWLDLAAGITRAQLDRAMRGHVLASAEMAARYGRALRTRAAG